MAQVLVIKLSSLGDLFFALPAFQAIRKHHAGDHLVLLTSARYRALMEQTGLFDEIWEDPRPTWRTPGALFRLRHRLRARRFARVYDLQWSERGDLYLRLVGRSAGERLGATAAADRPFGGRRERIQISRRQAAFLEEAGVAVTEPADLSFLAADLSHLPLAERFAVLVPGSGRGNMARRWPAEHYGTLAKGLAAEAIQPVVVIGPDEKDAAAIIRAIEPTALEAPLTIPEVAAIGRRASFAVSNDTGPGHILALAGTPTLMVFGGATDPVKQHPAGDGSRILQRVPLADLPPEEVLAAALRLER